MSNRYILRLGCMLAALALFCCDAASFEWPYGKRQGKATPAVAAPDTAKKPTPYQKFVKKKGLKTVSGYAKLYTDGTDVWLEVPDTLVGRKLILTTVLKDSTDPWVEVGQTVSSNKVFEIGRTDSLLVLFQPVRMPDSADSLERAMLLASTTKAIRYTFPIEMRNADTTAMVIKATKLFDPSNKDVIDIQALLYGDSRGLMKPAIKGELSFKSAPVRYGEEHLGVTRMLTLEGDDGTYSNGKVAASGNKGRISGTFVTMLSLVPETELAVRRVDPRVGVRKQAFRSFSSDKGVKDEFDAVRWRLSPGDHITVYIDTLFPATRREAVRRGVEAWNSGFRAAGLGDVVQAVPYPADPAFCADNPFICKVVPTSCDIDMISSRAIGTGLTGGILGATITVPQGSLTQIWRQYVFAIGAADSRFATLFPSEEALCEVLTASVMRSFGTVLGLTDNLAGSNAYSPQQLRDAAFTAEHGITASIMDKGVLYNVLARPGDREKGVTTVSNRIGTYDRFAIEWLYRVFPDGNDAEHLKALVDSHEGDPEYLYRPEQGGGMTARDYRGRASDLGNDPLEEYNARVATLKYVAANAAGWLTDPRLDESPDRYLFYEWMWLRFNEATQLLSSRLGGVTANIVGDGNAKFTPVPKATQKQYIKTIFDGWRNLQWMEADRDLLHLAGAYRTAQDFNYNQYANLTGVRNRLMNVFFAYYEAGSGYSPDEYLTDVEDALLVNVRSGRLEPQEDQSIGVYIMQTLISSSAVMKASYNREASPLGIAAAQDEVDLFTPIAGFPTYDVSEMDIVCRKHLFRVLGILRQGRSNARDANVRGRIDFLIRTAETALNNK